MQIARLCRFAWLLMLVFVAGLTAPVLASAALPGVTPAAATHLHVDGSVHSHGGQAGYLKAGAGRDVGKSPQCPGCLTDAACAVSCLGLAVLSVTTEWTASLSIAAWNQTPSRSRAGVAPAGDIDPPRLVLRS